MSDSPTILIVALSSDPHLNEDMRQAGADAAFTKSQFREVATFLGEQMKRH
jgi:hypothetical protein